VLRALREQLKPTGRMAFISIHPASGLGQSDYRRSLKAGPPAIGLRRRSHNDLLETAGFELVESVDLTDDYLEVRRLYLEQAEKEADQLSGDSRDDSVEDRLLSLRQKCEAVEEGLHRRTLFVARPI
jgi:hypothetical protein